MAQVRNNTYTKGMSGTIGKDMVFRNWNGKTFVSLKAQKPKTQSPKQKENRLKFKKATAFAKSMMKDPVKKAEYWGKAKKLKLPNAYTAAFTEYLRNPKIIGVDTSGFTGKTGDEIKITTWKKGFEVEMAEVLLADETGKIIEKEWLKKNLVDGKWIFKTNQTLVVGSKYSFFIKVEDRCGNLVESSVSLVF